MEKTVYDVIIIGAGPAGATLARLLGGARSVLLLDARTFGKTGFTREKCCGGLLAPDAAAQLRAMGLDLPEWVRDSAQPLSVRALDLVSRQERRYARSYVNLDRAAFEYWLLSLVPECVAFAHGRRCHAIRRHSGVWEVSTSGQHGERVFRGKLLVGAEGAASLVRRQFAPARSSCRLYLAVQDVFAAGAGEKAVTSEYAAFFHPGHTDFYGWVIPKKDRVLLGAALPPRAASSRNALARMKELRGLLHDAGYAFGEFLRHEACLVARPGPSDIFPGRAGAFCVGEAAGWISPSSAEGFSYAFASARALANAVLSGGGPERVLAAYRMRSLGLRANIVWKTCKSPFMYVPPVRRLIMASGIGAAR